MISYCVSYNCNYKIAKRVVNKKLKLLYMNDNDNINDLNNKSLEDLLDSVSDLPQDQVPQDISDAINNKIKDKIKESEPSDFEIRMRIMGFTPFTYAGFLLAGILIFLNSTLGTGWASRMLNLDDGSRSSQQQYEQSNSIMEGLKYRNSQLDKE